MELMNIDQEKFIDEKMDKRKKLRDDFMKIRMNPSQIPAKEKYMKSKLSK